MRKKIRIVWPCYRGHEHPTFGDAVQCVAEQLWELDEWDRLVTRVRQMIVDGKVTRAQRVQMQEVVKEGK